ncbi:MAG: hypothetical protein RLZZ241_1940 [Bacteroidota bacterium]|jgi:uncharacterized protein YgfB (UPF0149 family)
MDNQYCRVGASNTIAAGIEGKDWLERQYHYFMEKAAEAEQAESNLRDFFERKAQKLHNQLHSILHS